MTTLPNDTSAIRYPDDDLPEGSVVDGEVVLGPMDEIFDVVVVGSGAAGGVAAETLTRLGLSVAIVEEGPWLKTRDIKPDAHSVFPRVMRQQGMQLLMGRAVMPMLQGRCVGGSTFVNSAIAWRVPEDVIDDWRDRFGLGDSITMKGLEPHFEALEKDLGVRDVDDRVLGGNNRMFLEQCAKMGIEAARMKRYDRDCKGSSQCLTGCPSGAKQGMNVTYVPWALRHGARIFTSCRVEHVEIAGGRAVGVRARAATGKVLRIRARHAVVVAASTIQTPNVLRRSGVRTRALGRHFQAHPGIGMGGLFDRDVGMGFGATQGAESIHFRKTDRFKLETIALPPDIVCARIPGMGHELSERLAQLSHVAMWVTQVRAEAEGTVGEGWGGVDRVKYTLTPNDIRATRKALALIARMLFESGAREVWPGIYGLPSVMRSIDEAKLIEEGPLEPRSYGYIATHLFGAARMGPDPAVTVCDTDFRVHGTDGLYVVDSSVFPTNLGVNPQHTIMALSRLACTRLAEQARSAAAA
ncbi:MAG: GMC family oxidoreductase [Deltaproteobacteria bacterium]|nr:GMC family oxidoreductase [Deltaproteobacteria bacterium]